MKQGSQKDHIWTVRKQKLDTILCLRASDLLAHMAKMSLLYRVGVNSVHSGIRVSKNNPCQELLHI